MVRKHWTDETALWPEQWVDSKVIIMQTNPVQNISQCPGTMPCPATHPQCLLHNGSRDIFPWQVALNIDIARDCDSHAVLM